MSDRRDEIEIIARGLLIDRRCVLLCRNNKHGYYYLPGGHVDFGEAAASAVAREFIEETGLVVEVLDDPILVTEAAFETKNRRHHEINLVFAVKLPPAAGPVKSLEPAISFEWQPLEEVSGVDVRPASIKAYLQRMPSNGWWASEIGR